LIRLTLFLVFFLLLFSCNSENKSLNFNTKTIDKTYEADISASIDYAIGKSDLSQSINLNIEKAIVGSIVDANKHTDLNSVLNDFNMEYLKFKKDFPEAKEPIWELHIETEKIYHSKEIITMTISTYEFKGGAHGIDKIKLLNLNAITGTIINPGDLIEMNQDFENLAKIHFLKSLPEDNGQSKMEDYFFGKPFQLPENIGFSEEGLILLYNVYEIASYNQGYTEFVIPFEEAEPFLKVF
jgi:hypothetical protein